MSKNIFKLHNPFQPAGDQPAAISKLVEGLKKGMKRQTLLGATGTGKTFTMANVIAQFNNPTQALLTRPDVIIVASVSCIYGLGSPEEYEKVNLKLEVGMKMDRLTLMKKL